MSRQLERSDNKMSANNAFQVANIPWRNNTFTMSNKDPPFSDQGETIIGVYLLVLGWLSWFGNSIVIFVLYKQRASLQPTDYLTFNLAISDASISVFGYSRGILEIFNVFRDNGYLVTSIWTCQVDGFFTLVFGLSSINTLTVISVTRYIKGCHPGKDRGYGTCEINWAKANYSTVYKSYIISILIFCFFIPVLVMLFTYVSIINTVKRGNAMATEGDLTERQRKIERDVTIVSIVICTAFILAWSPYAVVSMWSACGFHVPSLTSIFTRLFAKSASFYNPLIYFGLSSKFRKDVAILLPCTSDGKDTVKLKRFKPKGDAHQGSGRGNGLKAPPHHQKEMMYAPGNPYPLTAIKAASSPDSGVGSPPCTPPPPANKEMFFIEVPHLSDGPEWECDRL
ncbi:opsin-5-like isoform X2 [Salmo trutta]|uniref:opsin-5-like isoform X2 n=1 Tax=Salmo trutta TaxID=8032 RepID=UPI00113297FE|nr:opsin-5-like isoform X2 [Salmo trutta]